MKIGILGGTFHPIHNGHIYLAKEALKQLQLDEVWILVAGIPPHKDLSDNDVTRLERLTMCKIAFHQENHLIVKEEEFYSLMPNYSYQTLTHLFKKYPQHDFYFIMGEDSLNQFESWVRPDIICQYASIVIATRIDSSTDSLSTDVHRTSLQKTCEKLQQKFSSSFYLLQTQTIDVSSTKIRKLLNETSYQQKENIALNADKLQLPKEVLQYIVDHKLYQHASNVLYNAKLMKPEESLDEIRRIEEMLKNDLKPKRYTHSLGVMYTASALAMRYCYPIETARIAGLLHDCAKFMSEKELIDYCERHQIKLSEDELSIPGLIHAKAGEYRAQEHYHIHDNDILSAIHYHTTGRPEMSLLEQIIFIADFIEPNRDNISNIKEIQEIAFYDLDFACAFIAKTTLDYLSEQHFKIDQKTQETYDYYKRKRG